MVREDHRDRLEDSSLSGDDLIATRAISVFIKELLSTIRDNLIADDNANTEGAEKKDEDPLASTGHMRLSGDVNAGLTQ